MPKHCKPSRDQEVFISFETVQKQLSAGISKNGGFYTIDALAQRLEGFEDLSAVAKQNLVRRVLELSERVREGKSVRMFIGIRTISGKLTQRRPHGLPPVEEEVIFPPEDL